MSPLYPNNYDYLQEVTIKYDNSGVVIGVLDLNIKSSLNSVIESYDYQRTHFINTYNRLKGYQFISEETSNSESDLEYFVYLQNKEVYIISGRYKNAIFNESFKKGSDYKPFHKYKNVFLIEKEKPKIKTSQYNVLKTICQNNGLKRNQCTCFVNKMADLLSKNPEALNNENFDKNKPKMDEAFDKCVERY